MKTANAWLIIGEKGSNVFKTDLTPAEVQLLVYIHHPVAGKCPVHDLKEVGEVKRSNNDEASRLRAKYGRDKVDNLFGKVNPRFPETFKDALVVPGMETPEDVIVESKPESKPTK